jgi:hypothetical protein
MEQTRSLPLVRLSLLLASFVCAACVGGERAARKARADQEERYRGKPEGGEPEEGELKRGSGISQLGLVTPGGRAQPSSTTAGADEDRLWSAYDDWEPVVAADKNSDWVYQMTTRLDGPTRAWVIFRASSDGGESYGPDQIIARSTRQQYDPQVAIAEDGSVLVCWLEVPQWETMFARSADHGRTWTAPVSVESSLNWTDHPWIAISPDGLDVHIAFNKTDSWVVSSHDGGATFLPPVRTHATGRTWYHTGGVVTPDGAVYFAGAEYHPRYDGPARVSVLRSTDRGASFAKIPIDRSLAPPPCDDVPGCYWGFIGPGTGIAADSLGSLMVVYNAGRTFKKAQQIYVRTSDDGLTWREAMQVSDPTQDSDCAFPVVAAGVLPGEFHVVWQGDRDGDMHHWNTWTRRTQDGGLTWGPIVPLSTRGAGADYQSPKGYAFPYGDYMNASVDGRGRLHAIWGAGRSYNGPGGTWYTRMK